jgi:AcrR family transcriptional regulator
MNKQDGPEADAMGDPPAKRVRADARRNLDMIVQAAKEVFIIAGVDAPVRAIADKAGVGVATLYRHFPQRSDLVAAVFRRELDACVDVAAALAAELPAAMALEGWLLRFADFVATKRGLSSALHSGDPAFNALPAYFDAKLRPALRGLVQTAVSAGEVRGDIDPDELISAVVGLCHSASAGRPGFTRRMIVLLVDGLRFRPGEPAGFSGPDGPWGLPGRAGPRPDRW